MADVTPTKPKVLVALSGGVDSAVAAGLLVERGHDVTGVFMSLGDWAARPLQDAGGVADRLGIELLVEDCREDLRRIIDDFVGEYARGRTPNPCILCNARIKFGRLMALADSLGAEYLATGHHARVVEVGSAPAIARAASRRKDQSYALFAIERSRLGRILLPIGQVAGKDEVRRIARSLGLEAHDKPDSQEICFVGAEGDYTRLIATRAPEALQPGNIVNAAGEVLGRHEGYARFTIGQRRRLGVAAGRPMYVTHIDPATATVSIGPAEEVQARGLIARQANWHRDLPEEFEADIQVRHNHPGVRGTVRISGLGCFEVNFDEPVFAVTPGQAAVVYDGDVLLGGGWIEEAR